MPGTPNLSDKRSKVIRIYLNASVGLSCPLKASIRVFNVGYPSSRCRRCRCCDCSKRGCCSGSLRRSFRCFHGINHFFCNGQIVRRDNVHHEKPPANIACCRLTVEAERLKGRCNQAKRGCSGVASHLHQLDRSIKATDIRLKLTVTDTNDAKRLVCWGSNDVLYVPGST
jgi:hypothetical protein